VILCEQLKESLSFGEVKNLSIVAFNARRIIRESGYKQKAVAQKAGYTEKSFSNLLRGRKTIAEDDIARLAVALNVTANELFATEDKAS